MEYMLTKDDIAKLVAAGLPGAMEGEIATPEDLQALGVTPQDTPEAPAITDDRSPGGNLAVEAMPAAPAVTAAAPVASDANILQQLLAAQAAPAAPADPYENLSKTQRRMLAFAGLSDAGAALQGRQGGNVNAVLGRFNEQADMQRKATAAQAQRQMLQGVMAGGAGTDPQARIQQLLNIALTNPQLAPGIALMVKDIQDQVKAAANTEGKVSQAGTQLEDVQALLDMINDDPFMTTGIMSSLLSGVKVTQAGQAASLQKTLKSNLALQALKDLKATGATMGALNTVEFQALESELTNLDLGLGAELAKRSLLRIQDKYQSLIADAFRDAEEQAAAGNPMGQRALDGLNRIFGGKPAWTENAGPVVPSDGTSDPLNIL